MKRYLKPLAAVLCLGALVVGAHALSSGDSLISLRYLQETFFPKAAQAGQQAADRMLQDTYDQALEDLDSAHRQATGQEDGSGSLYSATLQQREWSEGDMLLMTTGSGFLMLQGTATVSHNGAVVDVTQGAEVLSGSALADGHRYLVGEGTIARVDILSGYAALGVQGGYDMAEGKADPLPFYDVSQRDWYYAPVGYAYENGLFSGLEEHRFGPNEPMTRAMLMTVFYQMAGAPAGELASARAELSDVPAGAWYAPYVRWAVSQKIAAGTGADTFGPNDRITREQLVVLLHSFASNYLGRSLGEGADLSGYRDLSQASPWALQALSWAVGEGIISSTSTGGAALSPRSSASRAQVATMLRAFAEKI